MSISFSSALGIHANALEFRSRRAEVLANNLANSDTPGFQARDIRFTDTFKRQQSRLVNLDRTHQRHMKSSLGSVFSDKLYRIPIQPSTDGNTVDTQLEQSNYMRNAIEFQASFTFLNGRFRGLSAAIRGD